MKVLILCGGRGTRLGNEATYIPKAMVKLGQRPILWHVMKRYALAGFSDFVLALGSKGEMIKDYLTRYEYYSNDIRVRLGDPTVEDLTHHQEEGWEITLVDTGIEAMTGARIHRCGKYIPDDEFMVTYSDVVSTVNLQDLLAFHRSRGKIATVCGVIPPFREHEFKIEDKLAVGFYDAAGTEPGSSERYVNGGHMVFGREIFSYLNPYNECTLETEVFSQLIDDRQLAVYPHHGFWRWLDADRDYAYLSELADKNKMYWLYD